jgi:hypothetical protein
MSCPPVPPSAQIAAGLRASRAELDRRAAEATIRAIRLKGLTLQLSFERASTRWRLSDGAQVRPAVAKLVIADVRVTGVGDALFSGAASQTFRFAGEE